MKELKKIELVLNMLAEATTVEIFKEKEPQTFDESRKIARQGGEIAGNNLVTNQNAMELRAPKKVK